MFFDICLFVFLLLFNILIALSIETNYLPDEYYQYVEPSYNLVFGHGVLYVLYLFILLFLVLIHFITNILLLFR